MTIRRSTLGKAGVRAILLVLAGLAMQACGQAGASTSLAGADSPAIQPSGTPDCIAISFNVDPFPTDAGGRAAMSAIVVAATYQGPSGPAVWNTPDGNRPSPADVRTLRPRLNTPASLADVALLRSSLGAGPLLIPGGMNGCDSEVYSNQYGARLTQGARYVFFLDPARDTSGTLLDGGILADAWPVAADGMIGVPNLPMTEVELRALLEANPYRLASPSASASPAAFFLTVVDIDGPSVDIAINGTVVGHTVCQAVAPEAPAPQFSPSAGQPLPWSVEVRRADGTVLATFVETGDHGPRTIFLRAPGPYEAAYGQNPGPAPAPTCAP